MILYFTGTGNSAYAAKRIREKLQDDIYAITDSIRQKIAITLHSKRPWVIVTPTYAWRIPRIVQDWLRDVKLTGNRSIYFVMTCGGSIGNAGIYLEKLCDAKQMQYRGCMGVTMPENYIALFDAPKEEEARQIINRADFKIAEAAEHIQEETLFPNPEIHALDVLNSSLINPLFYPLIVHARKFYVTDVCIGCGKCEQVCPLGNIQLKQETPIWGKNCTHCMACICSCPKEAIEYGNSSKGKVRYLCSHIISEE